MDNISFLKATFDADAFLSHYKREYSLERLRDDLNIFLKVLEMSMCELINKDYPDFVNLSTNLVLFQRVFIYLVFNSSFFLIVSWYIFLGRSGKRNKWPQEPIRYHKKWSRCNLLKCDYPKHKPDSKLAFLCIKNVKKSIDREIECVMNKLNEKLIIEKRRIVLKLLINWQRSFKVTNEMIGNSNSEDDSKYIRPILALKWGKKH